MTDKSKELSSTIKLVNYKLQFMGFVSDNAPISIDYIAPLGDDQGYTSLELLLLSLSSCMGSAVLTLLRKMRKTITQCDIQATGLRREEHPTGFKNIHVKIDLKSEDVTAEDMKKVVDMAEDKYCPVWAMIKGNTHVEIEFKVIGDK